MVFGVIVPYLPFANEILTSLFDLKAGATVVFKTMNFIIGSLTVIICVFGGYMAMGGKLKVLWQPFEVVIIVGAALGAMITANTPKVLKGCMKCFGLLLKGEKHKKADFVELLTLQYAIFKLLKSKGPLAIEQHIENPQDSTLFQQFPKFYSDKYALTFICDYLRMITLGSDNPHETEALMDEEIETHHHEHAHVAHAIQNMADGMPALGIVAAVLGVIKTMGSITEPPEVLGKLIGGALVGTFLGVWLAYGFIGPMAASLTAIFDAETKYLQCIKAGMLAYLHGSAPAVAVEFARKTLHSHVRPTFYELEQAVQNLPSNPG